MDEMARECQRHGLMSVRERDRKRERETEPWLGFKVFEASEKAEQKWKEDLGPKRRRVWSSDVVSGQAEPSSRLWHSKTH